MCLCRFAAERDDDLAMESSFAQQQFEEQRRYEGVEKLSSYREAGNYMLCLSRPLTQCHAVLGLVRWKMQKT